MNARPKGRWLENRTWEQVRLEGHLRDGSRSADILLDHGANKFIPWLQDATRAPIVKFWRILQADGQPIADLIPPSRDPWPPREDYGAIHMIDYDFRLVGSDALTLLRPGFFPQNHADVHQVIVRDDDDIEIIPAIARRVLEPILGSKPSDSRWFHNNTSEQVRLEGHLRDGSRMVDNIVIAPDTTKYIHWHQTLEHPRQVKFWRVVGPDDQPIVDLFVPTNDLFRPNNPEDARGDVHILDQNFALSGFDGPRLTLQSAPNPS